MDDLIKALQIFRKYDNSNRPTNCDHDVLRVSVDPADVSDEDKAALSELSFEPDDDLGCFESSRFGSN